MKVKETQRSDRPDTADHDQPAANSNEQNNRHSKPRSRDGPCEKWLLSVPLRDLLVSLCTRLSVQDTQ